MKTLMQNLLKLQTLELGKARDSDIAAAIAELRGKIPPQILVHYDRLRARGKKGITAVRNQVCTGCHMGLTLATIMTLKHGLDVQLCDSCGRYLYLPEETESTAAEQSAPTIRRHKKTVPMATLATVQSRISPG